LLCDILHFLVLNMALNRAFSFAALLAGSHGQSCEDETALLQSKQRQAPVATQVQQKGVQLLESANRIISMVNAQQDPGVCGEATGATRAALQEVLPTIPVQHQQWVEQLRIAAEIVESCGSQGGDLGHQGNEVERARETHRACRTNEHEMDTDKTEKCERYEQLRADNLNRNVAFPNDEDGFPEAVDRAKVELENLHTQATQMQESCSTARGVLNAQREECSSAQQTFEDNYCVFRANCAGVQACRTNAEEAFRQVEEAAQVANEALRSEYQVLKHVECLVGLADQALAESTIVPEGQVAACSEPASTEEFTLVTPTLPEANTCMPSILSRPPCQADFLQVEYAELPQQASIQAACTECPALQVDITLAPDPPTSQCCGTFRLDFNSGVDDQGASSGELVFQSEGGLTVRFTDDGSEGNQGGQADGVHITDKGYGNRKVGTTDLVMGANNIWSNAALNYHSSGIVAHFSCGARRVSLMDADDDSTLKTLFAFGASGDRIGQSEALAQTTATVDAANTDGGALIYSVEFDTLPGTAGGASDGTFFTIDDLVVELPESCQ
jgi:hypothetical protein